VGSIPLEAFCAGVPRKDVARPVERENGIIANGLDEKPVEIGRYLASPG
jgi:hypothetical protein